MILPYHTLMKPDNTVLFVKKFGIIDLCTEMNSIRNVVYLHKTKRRRVYCVSSSRRLLVESITKSDMER